MKGRTVGKEMMPQILAAFSSQTRRYITVASKPSKLITTSHFSVLGDWIDEHQSTILGKRLPG